MNKSQAKTLKEMYDLYKEKLERFDHPDTRRRLTAEEREQLAYMRGFVEAVDRVHAGAEAVAKESLDEAKTEFQKVVYRHSPNAFVNMNGEIIIVPSHNVYFHFGSVRDAEELRYKVLTWLARPSHKGLTKKWHTSVRQIVNEFLGTTFTEADMSLIYGRIGMDADRDLADRFIASGYDLELLKEEGL